MKDEGVAEFCRFYIDRRKEELTATGADPRKRKKIEDDFTPRLEAHLIGLEASVRRQLSVKGISNSELDMNTRVPSTHSV
jgi:hypothetical protein